MVSIYSRENHQFPICYREFDKFVCKTSEMAFFQNIVSFFSRSPICKYFLKILLFCVTCWENLENFSCFFHFFEKFFWWKSQQVTFFLLFFYMKKELHVGEIKKNVIRKSDFFCKIYRHVRHSLILICTLMSSMGKIDQHFEKMI